MAIDSPPDGMEQPADSWFRALAEAAADGVLVIDETSVIVFANQAIERLLGYPQAELVGQPLTRLMPERLRARHEEGLHRYLATGERRVEWAGAAFSALARDGHELPVEVAFAEFVAEGGHRLFAGFVRDRRERQVREEVLQEHYDEAARRARMLETVGELARVVFEAPDLELALRRIVEAVHERLGLPVAQVFLAEDGRDDLMLRAQATAQPIDSVPGENWSPGAGIVGRAFRTATTQLALDIAVDPDYVAVNREVRAEMAVPIHLEGRCLGVLNLESSAPADFSDENVLILRMLADQVAGAISLTMTNQRLTAAVARLSHLNQELHSATDSLVRVARTDGLTGLANRRCFDEALEREWRRCRRDEQPLSLILLDVDHFKAFNDRRGHPEGDRCLQQVAQCFARLARRASDLVARFGGDEFAILMAGQPAEPGRWLAERLRAGVESLALPHPDAPAPPSVLTVSAGVATGVPRDDSSSATLVAAADRNLYAAKQAGRNRVTATLLGRRAGRGRRPGP